MGDDVTIILKAVDRATAVIRGVEGTLKRLGGASASVGGVLGTMTNLFAGGLTTVGTMLNLVVGGIRILGGIASSVFHAIGSVVEKVIDTVMGLGNKLMWVAGILTGLATAAVYKLGQSALDLAGNWEMANIAFKSMLGSQAAATAFLNDMRQLAMVTPFTFTQIRGMAQQFMAFGISIKSIPRYITAISDAVSAMGGSAETTGRVSLAIGQMMTLGKVNSRDMLQLTQAGIQAWDMMAGQLGVTTAQLVKMSEQGLIPASKGVEALVSAIEGRFGGMSKAMMNTWPGALSNLVDAYEIAMQQIGTPLAQQGTKIVKALTATISQLSDSGVLEKIGNTVAGWFSVENIQRALNFFANVVNMGAKAFDFIQEMWAKVIGFLSDETHIRKIAVVFFQLTDYVKALGKTIWGVFKDVYGIVSGVADVLVRMIGAVKIAMNTLRIIGNEALGRTWQNSPHVLQLYRNAQKGEEWLTKGIGTYKMPAMPQWGAGNDPRADALVERYHNAVSGFKGMFTSTSASWVADVIKNMQSTGQIPTTPKVPQAPGMGGRAVGGSSVDSMLERIYGGGARIGQLAARFAGVHQQMVVRLEGGTADQQSAIKQFCDQLGIPITGAMPMQRGARP